MKAVLLACLGGLRRHDRRTRTSWLFVGAVGLTLAGVNCILTDRGIDVVPTTQENSHAVRLVEPVVLRPDEKCSCEEVPDTCEPACPLSQGTGLPHYLDPEDGYVYCECPAGEYDSNFLSGLEFYVEDEDYDAGAPPEEALDSIHAVLLLDAPVDESPVPYVAYRDAHPGRLSTDFGPYDRSVIKRPDPQTRRLFVGDAIAGTGQSGVDLCNAHGQVDKRMGQRHHSLSVLVTDREWYSRLQPETGNLVQQIGVPDIKEGATWDRLDYVFYCSDETDRRIDPDTNELVTDPYGCAAQCVEDTE